jgi:AmmeMemoRadiSam system protein B
MRPDHRRAAVAGHFYPDDPRALRQLVVDCLAGIESRPRCCLGAIVPHAGLMYSGKCAGAVFARMSWPQTMVILAPNHTGVCGSPGASIWRSGAFETPIGAVLVDERLATALEAECDLVAHDPAAHRSEHAIEVELPFVAALAPRTQIVPLVIAWDDWDRSERLAAALADVVMAHRGAGEASKEILLLASSDMTHYETAQIAAHKDAMAFAAIESLDGRALLEVCARERITMCGRAPAAIVLEAARRLGATEARVVDYRHSGMVSGTDHNVVSYGGVIVEAL